MENIQKFRKKGKKLGEYMMTKLRLLRDQKKYRSRGVTLKYMLDRGDSRDLIIVFSSCTRKGIRARYNYVRTLKEVPCNKLFLAQNHTTETSCCRELPLTSGQNCIWPGSRFWCRS